jgi:hypothetical protein
MNITMRMLCKVAAATALFAAMTASAPAQNLFAPKMTLGDEPKRALTPEEQARQQKLDEAYKAATNKIPDQKANDPWATVRQSPPMTQSRK